MATKVTLSGGGIRDTITHSVYTKAKWSDEWTPRPYLHCDESAWSVSPSIPTATLHWYYGDIAHADSVQFTSVGRLALLRMYVKVVYHAVVPYVFYGLVEVTEDDLDGVRFWSEADGTVHAVPMGELAFSVYGIEQLLANHIIRNSRVFSDTGKKLVERGIPFNENAKRNRHGSFNLFGNWSANLAYWTSRDIVEYLLAWQTPRTKDDAERITFLLPGSSAECIPDWDRPQLDQHLMTTYDMLSAVISRQRLLFWYLEVDETKTPAVINLRVDTVNASPVLLDLPDAVPIPANRHKKHLVFDWDNSARAALKTTAVEYVDQFRVHGARRRSVFSVGFDDATLAVGWTAGAEATYEEAAKYAASLPAPTELTKRRKRHAEARSAEEVKDVYVRFTIPETWNGKVGAGDGTTPVIPAFPIIAADGMIEDNPAAFYALGLQVDQVLPLYEDVNYGGDVIQDGTVDEADSTGVERTPLVAWKLPNTDPQRWQDVEKIGRKADIEGEDPDEIEDWSCDVTVPPHERGIRLHVRGEPTHILAKTDFSPQPEDITYGDHDFRDMICTLSVTEDRPAEGVYPPDSFLNADADFLRRKIITAGDNFHQDYVCPHTIVDIDDNGDLVRSSGGFVRDDTAELRAVARVAYEWYGRHRQVLSLSTEIITGEIVLGDFIEEIGDDADPGEGHNIGINSVVTEIRIATRRTEGSAEPEPPRMLITTGWGELDPLQLIGPEDAPKDGRRPKDIMVTPFDFSRGV